MLMMMVGENFFSLFSSSPLRIRVMYMFVSYSYEKESSLMAAAEMLTCRGADTGRIGDLHSGPLCCTTASRRLGVKERRSERRENATACEQS